MPFSQYLEDNGTTLKISGNTDLTDLNIEELADFLKDHPEITTLNMNNCRIGNDGFKILVEKGGLTNIEYC